AEMPAMLPPMITWRIPIAPFFKNRAVTTAFRLNLRWHASQDRPDLPGLLSSSRQEKLLTNCL
ncbi:MAG: hypothetical protein M0Z89_13225, partial [Nitrospiraceae bacterium]|nr:hypothetical protein [Nitrospiraceae bacterium]